MDTLTVHVPRVRLRGLAAGIHAVAWLRDGADELEIVEQAGPARSASIA
jgi:hypothetical protein